MAFHRGLDEVNDAGDGSFEADCNAAGSLETAALDARLTELEGLRPSVRMRAAPPVLHVLYVDDHDSEAKRISAAIQNCPEVDVALFHADCADSARRICEAERIDVVVADFWLGGGTTAHTIDDLIRRCRGGAILLSSLDPDIVGRTVGDAEDLIVLSKSALDGAAFERAFRAAGHLS